MQKETIVLIGMPWSGKSTIGVLLAKALRWNFIDTDLLIQADAGKSLQQIIDEEGLEQFRKIEEKHIRSIITTHCVIATGGSVIYSDKAMHHLKTLGYIIYLKYPYVEINRRARSVEERGLVMVKGQTLFDLYQERTPIYQEWAEITIDCYGMNHEQVVESILYAWQNKLSSQVISKHC